MASQYVKDLRIAAKTLREHGWDFTAGLCTDSAGRMERMEQIIVDMQEQLDSAQQRHERDQTGLKQD